jgi:AcrR family transcriptional regulator
MSNYTGGYTTVRVRPLTPAGRRILETASGLFYDRGIHAIGVDAIAGAAGVTKKTIYDQFGSKDALVAAYLGARDERWRRHVTERVEREPAGSVERLLATYDALGEWMDRENPRGCAFVNAAAELVEPGHPGLRVVHDEKRWLRGLYASLAAEAGAPEPDRLAAKLLTLHEGALVSYSVAGDRDAAATAREAAAELVAAALAAR